MRDERWAARDQPTADTPQAVAPRLGLGAGEERRPSSADQVLGGPQVRDETPVTPVTQQRPEQRPEQSRGAQEPAPLSFVQPRHWFLAQLDPATTLASMPLGFRLDGP